MSEVGGELNRVLINMPSGQSCTRTQQGTIRILILLKVGVRVESISRIQVTRLPEQLWRQRLGAESPARAAARLVPLAGRERDISVMQL